MRFLVPLIGLLSFQTFAFEPGGYVQNILKPFTSDGCSHFPDGTFSNPTKWRHCCIKHDIAYWAGGTVKQRRQADVALQACVASTGEKAIAELILIGVGFGGSAYLPTSWRWGYGWVLDQGYRPLTIYQQSQVEDQRELIPRDLTTIPTATPPDIPIRDTLTGDYCIDQAVLHIEGKLTKPFVIQAVSQVEIKEDKASDLLHRAMSVTVEGCSEPFQFSEKLLHERNCTRPMDDFTARQRIRVYPLNSPVCTTK